MRYTRRRQSIAILLLIPSLAYAQAVEPPPPAAAQPAPPDVTLLPQVDVIGASPLLGSGVDRNKVPAETQVLLGTPSLDQEGSPTTLNTLQDQTEGVSLNNAAGGPYQPNLNYHGFQASPLQGSAEELAVYLNGVRFNSAFGDTVNWDLIPDIAINRIDIEGANPVFGLNALGGSLSVQLKNGFTYQGGEFVLFGGSFSQVEGQFQYGKQVGNVAVYVAATGLHEDGWRYFQSSGIKQFYGDIGWRSDFAEVHVNVDSAQSQLQAPGTTPIEWLDADPRSQFTGPSPIGDNYLLVSTNGNVQLNPTTSLQGVAYYDYFLQRVGNGNSADFGTCNTIVGYLCESGTDVLATTRTGASIPNFIASGNYADYDSTTSNSNGYGTSLQVTNTDRIFGFSNHVVAGVSFDGADTLYNASTLIGGFSNVTENYIGPGVTVDQADGTDSPIRASIFNHYYGVYAADIFDITPRLSASLAGRFNAEEITIDDAINPGLGGSTYYQHFNPAAGLTYKLTPNVSLYGGYAESNRAPTTAELTCSSAASPCSLANFFTGDPPLKQVIARTFEFGVRGHFTPYDGARADWNLSLYRSNLDDDITFIQSVILGRGYYQNIGDTRRQGVDAGLKLTSGRWTGFLNYSYVDATFQSNFTESSPLNPYANAAGNVTVNPGDRLPGIPDMQLKIGAQYKITDRWVVGANGVASTGQYLFGDEPNLTSKVPGYFVLNLNSSYQVTKNVQLFTLVQNALDEKYYNYGTFSPTNTVVNYQALGTSNPRSYNIAAPIGAFGGVRVTF